MEEKNTGLKVLVALLTILLLGSIGYIAYDKIILDKKDNDEVQETDDEKKGELESQKTIQSIEFDEQTVNEQLKKYIFIAEEDGEGYLFSNATTRLQFLNRLMTAEAEQGCDYQCAFISEEKYKAKYEEIYGTLEYYEADTSNVSGAVFSQKISDVFASDVKEFDEPYVVWNTLFGMTPWDLIKYYADEIKYDPSTNIYTITGTLEYKSSYDSSNDKTGIFELQYSINNGKKYVIGGRRVFNN